MVSLCHNGMTEESILQHCDQFDDGQQATRMIFVREGKMQYFKRGVDDNPVRVWRSMYVCEMALWLQWKHRGRLTAAKPCELVLLDAGEFRAIVKTSSACNQCRTYAHLYANAFMELQEDNAHDAWIKFDVAQKNAQTAFEVPEKVTVDDITSTIQLRMRSMSIVTTPPSQRNINMRDRILDNWAARALRSAL